MEIVAGRVRSLGRWHSLFFVLVFLAFSLLLVQHSDSIRSDVLLSLSLRKQSHQSFMSASFIVIAPQQSKSWPKPTIHEGKSSSALEFLWMRTSTGSRDHESAHDYLKKGEEAKSANDGSADDERNDESFMENIASESLIDGGVSTESNHSHSKDEMKSNPVMGMPTSFGIRTTQNRRSRWKRLLSIPGSLPGKPLLLRLMRIKSSETVCFSQPGQPLLPAETQSATAIKVDRQGQKQGKKRRFFHSKTRRPKVEGRVNKSLIMTEEELEYSDSDIPLPPFVEDKHVKNTVYILKGSSPEKTQAKNLMKADGQYQKQRNRRRFFLLKTRRPKMNDHVNKSLFVTKEELECPVVVRNISDLQSAVLVDNIPLRDVGFRFPAKGIRSEILLGEGESTAGNGEISNASFTNRSCNKETIFMRDDPVINGSLASLMTCNAKSSLDPDVLAKYQKGIALMSLHPVLSILRERVRTNSKPGDRQASPGDIIPHLALAIEGGGMRGAVSAGMAAALSTLDLLDAFDSIHGSSAGAIVGAYLVSRQLCTDVYTDIMPAAGSMFASKRRGMVNFGVDWLEDLIKRKSLEEDSESDKEQDTDRLHILGDDELSKDIEENGTSWWCEDDVFSSEELAREQISEHQSNVTSSSYCARRCSDDHYDWVLFELVNHLLSRSLSFGMKGGKRLGRALRPALSALDLAVSLSHCLRRTPGMNLTYVLDGVMDSTHGLRPFDIAAFRANDKRQPLYIIASAVTNGGKGDMETVAFNDQDGDFFGWANTDDSLQKMKESMSWYKRTWNMLLKYIPYSIFKVNRRASVTDDVVEYFQPMKNAIQSNMIPAGTSAMYGFSARHKIHRMSCPQEERVYDPTGCISDEGKKGIFPCLEASMLVPGAAGPPLQLIRSKNRRLIEQQNRRPRFRPRHRANSANIKETNSHLCYDAFCYEPIPYRTAVEKANATHVLALRSRPDGCVIETRQHMYERVVGPIYFRKHGMNQVAKLFSSGGSQYRYIEDVLTLNEGLAHGINTGRNNNTNESNCHCQGVKVPPTQLIYGNSDKPAASVVNTVDWKRAHLLPITLPFGTPELPALSQDKDEVISAVRNGYAAAYDVLAPISNLPFDSSTISGEKVASILFPGGEDDVATLNKPIKVKPSYIDNGEEETKRRSFAAWITRKREAKLKAKDEINAHPDGALARRIQRRTCLFHETDQYVRDDSNTLEYIETEALLAALPGFRGGRLDHIAGNLLAKEDRERKN